MLSIFGHFAAFGGLVSNIFQKYAWKDAIHTVILAILQKIQHFHLKRNLERILRNVLVFVKSFCNIFAKFLPKLIIRHIGALWDPRTML